MADAPSSPLQALATSPPPSTRVRLTLFVGLPIAAAYVAQVFSWQYWLVIVVAAALIHILVPKPIPETDRHKRRMSFSSEILAHGGFPAKAGVSHHIISPVVLFRELPSTQALSELWERTFLTYERFHSSLDRQGQPGWVPVEVAVAKHFLEEKVADNQELWTRSMRIAMSQFEFTGVDNPRWQIHMIENLSAGPADRAGSERHAVIVRVDHCVGDGISLMQAFYGALLDVSGNAMAVPGFARREAKFGMSAKMVAQIGLAAVKVLALPMSSFDSPTLFNGGLEQPRSSLKNWSMEGDRHLVLFPTLPMDFVKQLKTVAGVTVNDVLFAMFAGGVRRYCLSRQDPLFRDGTTKALQMRALMPIAFPRPAVTDPSRTMRNKWCFLSVSMPMLEKTARERVESAARTTTELKSSPIAPVQLSIQNKLLPWVPVAMAQDTAYQLFRRHSVVFSNVPGPQEPVFWAGSEVVGCQMLYPNLLPQVGILSYNELVYGNLCVDPKLVDDAGLFRQSLLDELRELADELQVAFPAELEAQG